MYRYTDSQGIVEEQYYFDSSSLDYFSPQSILSMPLWASDVSIGNKYSLILSSLVQYTQAANGLNGFVVLSLKKGMLPLSVSSWYVENPHDDQPLNVTVPMDVGDDILINLPLGYIISD